MNRLLLISVIALILLVQCRDETVPKGKVRITEVAHVTHCSFVVTSQFFEIADAQGLQDIGITVEPATTPNGKPITSEGSVYKQDYNLGITGVSGLKPDTRYIVTAFFENGYNTIFSDTAMVTTGKVETFTDPRDGKVYPMKLYDRLWWMVRNLDYETSGSRRFNDSSNLPEEFGRLYIYEEAAAVCPPGWRLPTDDDWKSLEASLGIPAEELGLTAERGGNVGSYMKEPGLRLWSSSNVPDADNRSGFSVVPSGSYSIPKSEFSYAKSTAGFWAQSSDGEVCFPRLFDSHINGVRRLENRMSGYMFSVRCVK